eukprot:6463351-Amphidinium_carterae.2
MARARLPAPEPVLDVEQAGELAVLPAAPFVVGPHQRVNVLLNMRPMLYVWIVAGTLASTLAGKIATFMHSRRGPVFP